jgi:dihydrofolate reductase
MSKVLLYIAQTLDGYIADKHDELTFLDAYNDYPSIHESFKLLDQRVGVEIMGRRTYDWMLSHGGNFSKDHEIIVISSKNVSDQHVQFYSGDLKTLIENLKKNQTKDIWLVGGGVLIKSFIELDLIDEYQIAILPVLIGSGVPLFHQANIYKNLSFVKSECLGDIVLLTYLKT